jgi:two-component system cell cycle sensor histidine kinase/response regulator CckA
MVAGNARDAAAGVPSAAPLARVLFIDDEPSLVRLADRTLERERYQVFGYTSPDAALHDLARGHVDCDVVVTDFAMPGLSGLDVAARVRATRPDLPVLLSSGRLSADDEDAIRALGVREIIPKPNTLPELTAALGRLFVSGPTVSAAMQDSVRMVRVGV